MRLWRREFWRRDKEGKWKIYEHVQGIFYETDEEYHPNYPIIYAGDETDDEEETKCKNNTRCQSEQIDKDERHLYEPEILDRREVVFRNRLELETNAQRILWNGNYGKYECNLCAENAEGWCIEELNKLFKHISNRHEKLAQTKPVFCPYCPAHYCTKDILQIHLGLKKQRGNGGYIVKTCVAIPEQVKTKTWDDMLIRNNQPPDVRNETR